LSEHPVLYAGQQFPTMRENQNFDFVVLRIFDEELGKKWQAGLYLFDEDIAKIEQAVQACTAKLSRARSKLQTPASLAYSMLHSGGEPREQGSNPRREEESRRIDREEEAVVQPAFGESFGYPPGPGNQGPRRPDCGITGSKVIASSKTTTCPWTI
jgi:hypothetical protein